MEKEFIGKNIEVKVAFSGFGGGPLPIEYQGKLESLDEEYLKIIVERLPGSLTKVKGNNSILINKKYIILIREL